MLRGMTRLALAFLWIAAAVTAAAAPPPPEAVAILYNSAVPESKKLAETYRAARNIPEANLVGLDLPQKADISRAEYEKTLRDPLRREFESRGWYTRAKDSNGIVLPVQTRIVVMAVMRGVPLRIQPGPKPEGFKPDPQNPLVGRDEASVDSELAMFGIDGVSMEGVLKNQFFQSEKPIVEAGLPFLLLTGRIDGVSYATCERMIRDSVEVEKTGLWGFCYVDIANKFPQGDQWLEAIVKSNLGAGIPTVVDRFNDTLPKSYPMTQAALYYGWYDWNLSGPFLGPNFQFRKGAVAMHLHSFSAQQLGDMTKNWSAGLLEKGAAATVGNVFEPYLHLTHHFEILHQRLLEGHTLVEAAWMAMPVASWQGVVLGDPLYRPFRHAPAEGEVTDLDRDFRAVRMAMEQWQSDPSERRQQLEAAAERTGSGAIAEAIGLDLLNEGRTTEAATWFRNAKANYTKTEDKMRQDFHLIGIDRAAGKRDEAIRQLRSAQTLYRGFPEAESLQGWLDILDPPAPPPADPTKLPVR